mgnify:FL=1
MGPYLMQTDGVHVVLLENCPIVWDPEMQTTLKIMGPYLYTNRWWCTCGFCGKLPNGFLDKAPYLHYWFTRIRIGFGKNTSLWFGFQLIKSYFPLFQQCCYFVRFWEYRVAETLPKSLRKYRHDFHHSK